MLPQMPSTTLAYRATIGLIWALALWHSWICRGLFVDGSAFLLNIVLREGFFDFYAPRLYAMLVAQVPIITALTLGVTDLHLLGRLLSLGLFGLPTLLYTLALVRARNEPVLLAVVIAAIGIVFLTTSFFIVGEYNSAYAIAILVAVRLVTAERLTIGDGLVLAIVSALGMRTYEVFIYLGPLLALMTVWQVWRMPHRPTVPSVLHLLSAGFFIKGMLVAIDSVVHPYSQEHLSETYFTALNFWQNMQFDLAFIPVVTIAVWALVRSDQLGTAKPYRWAIICIVLLALSPLLAVSDTLVRPLAKSQYVARTVGGLVIAAMVIFMWCYGAERFRTWRVRLVLRGEATRRRLLALACLILLAVLPSDVFLSITWHHFLRSFRQVVVTHSGVVAFEDTPLARPPDFLLVENWVLTCQSLILRSRRGDGVVAPPRDYTDWVPFPPTEPPNLGQFYWRD
jgi:hypothetical protein